MPVVVVVVVAVMRGDGGGLKGARGRQGRGAAVAGRWRRVAVILLALAYAASMLVVFLGGGAGGVAVAGAGAGALRQRGAPAPAGSVYRSHLVLDRLLPELRASSASRPHPVSDLGPWIAAGTPSARVSWLVPWGTVMPDLLPAFHLGCSSWLPLSIRVKIAPSSQFFDWFVQFISSQWLQCL